VSRGLGDVYKRQPIITLGIPIFGDGPPGGEVGQKWIWK
jgi:hypothetical protein